METKFKQLDTELEHKDTVLSFVSPVSMFKVHELISAMKSVFQNSGLNVLIHNLKSRGQIPSNWDEWINKGVPCEILKPGTEGWKKGKLRIKFTLEFCPDEPEITETSVVNQLDDICRKINGVS